MSHDHDHDHDHAHDDHAPIVDDRAAGEHEILTEAIIDVLEARGILTRAEVAAAVERVDQMAVHGVREAARAVARAWVDPAYRARLVATPKAAVAELGIDIGATELYVVENTQAVHNLIVCTLCSCYPREFLGRQPDWYKKSAYRSRAVREPRAVLAEFGTHLPEDVEVRVHDSSADLRYVVLPERPAGTEGWSEARLADLVSRDSLIGVRLAATPGAA